MSRRLDWGRVGVARVKKGMTAGLMGLLLSSTGHAMEVGNNSGYYGLLSFKSPDIRPFKDEAYSSSTVYDPNFFSTTTDPWNPNYIMELENYSTFRFMDWSRINTSTLEVWNDRIKHDDPNQSCDFSTTAGTAYEWQVSLGNKAGCNIWVNIPMKIVSRNGIQRGSNDFVRKLAILVKHGVDMGTINLSNINIPSGKTLVSMTRQDYINAGGVATLPQGLNSAYKVYFEYGNETWNPGSDFKTSWCSTEGLALGLNTQAWRAGIDFQAWAGIRVFKDVEEIFGSDSSRVMKIEPIQTTSGARVEYALEIYRNPTWNPYGVMPDAFSSTWYFGRQQDGASANVMNELKADIDSEAVGWADISATIDAASVVDGRNYKYIAYEGGSHVTKNADKCVLKPGIYDVYAYALSKCEPLFDEVIHFQHGGLVSAGNAWGSVVGTTGSNGVNAQPTFEETLAFNHRYRALYDYIKDHQNVVTKPAAPSGLSAAAASSSAVDLSFTDNADNETSFNVNYRKTGVSTWTAQSFGASSGTGPVVATVSGLTADTGYDFQVCAVNSAGSSAYTSTKTATTLSDGGGGDITTLYECETLSKTSSDTVTTYTDSTASGGKWDYLQANAVGDYVEYTLNVAAAGTYTVKYGYKAKSSRGVCQLKIDGSNQGSTVNQSVGSGWLEADLGSKTLTAGNHTFRFQVTAANSGSYALSCDVIKLTGSSAVVDNPPVANAGSDITVTDSDNSGSESVTLDGSASTDDNGISSYTWTEGSTQLGTGATLSKSLSVGTHTITLTVKDAADQTDTDTVVVTVNAGEVIPDGVITFSTSGGDLVLDWADYTGAGNFTNYRVYRNGSILSWWELQSTYTDSPAPATGTEYRVVAWDNSGKVELAVYTGTYTGGDDPDPVGISDDFESGGFSGGTGWAAASWTTTGPSWKMPAVTTANVPSAGSGKAADIYRDGAIERTISLSGAKTLTYDYKTVGLDADESAVCEVLSGGSWSVKKTYTTNTSGSDSVALTGSETAIRFRCAASMTSELLSVDDIEIK